jgi:hypothetical protein
MSASVRQARACSNAGSISAWVPTSSTNNCRLSCSAATPTALVFGSGRLVRYARRRAVGATAASSSTALAVCSTLKPAALVTLPQGRARLATHPAATASPAANITIGTRHHQPVVPGLANRP